jgi:aspartate racemase
MTRHIGIVGCSAEGAALCYRTICLEAEPLMGRYAHPEVSMHTIALAEYMKPIEAGAGWEQLVGELMLRSAEALKRAGADFLICPAEEVGKEAKRRGFKKLGLTGTKFLVSGPVYPEKLGQLGIGYVLPTEAQQERINAIIFNELVLGRQTRESLAYFQQVIEQFKSDGCDAVVLGCTEIPLLVNDSNSPLPTLDSTRTLARAALRHAIEK